MGYALHRVEAFGAPFQVVHEQIVSIPAQGHQKTLNDVRKLLFVLSGECRHRIVGWEGPWNDLHLHPGDILSLPCACEQNYSALKPDIAVRLHVIRLAFDPNVLPPLSLGGQKDTGSAGNSDTEVMEMQALAEGSLRQILYLRGAAQDAVFQETLTHLRDEARRRLPGYRLRIHNLCSSLTVLFARKAQENRLTAAVQRDASTSEYHVGKIKGFLRGQPLSAPQLTQIAGHLGLSEEHTARIFRKVTGMTLSEYVRRRRIEMAKNLLATTEKNLSEIAHLSGYASLTVFSRSFKQEESITPSEFRHEIARQMG